MRDKNVVIGSITAAIILLALLAGLWAARVYQDRAPSPATAVEGGIGLAPLPDWVGEPLPDFTRLSAGAERKAAFFEYLFPRIALANQRILNSRGQVQYLAGKAALNADDEAFLATQAARLRIDAAPGSPQQFDLLLRRLDMVPPSLVMAQAANESAWGTSRFARQGNNLFGQWCFSPGCGLVPSSRPAGASHEVARYESPYQSVRSYLTNLNRHPSYQELRDGRAQLRAENRAPSGAQLATGLQAYSERGDEYIAELLQMMKTNQLQRYDQVFGEWLHLQAEVDEPYVLLRQRQAGMNPE